MALRELAETAYTNAKPGAALLPSAIPEWPVVARLGREVRSSRAEAQAALARIRAHHLHWPVPRHDAAAPASVAVTGRGRRMRLTSGAPLSSVRPDNLVAIDCAADHPAAAWALLGGLTGGDDAATELLRHAVWPCPWSRRPLAMVEGVEALLHLHRAAAANAAPVATVAMSRWKRRAVAPFLTGPHGAPTHFRAPPTTPKPGTVIARWGDDGETDRPGDASLAIEDGFFRSVGLGLRNIRPASLVVSHAGLHHRPGASNGLEQIVATAEFSGDLLARARRLRQRILQLDLTKYNLGGVERLPDPGGRHAILVPGQVEGDASLRNGARGARSNLDLLHAARAAHPDAFILYKPHPDVLTGLRRGGVPQAALAGLADAVATRAPAQDCIAWCDRVVTMTSQLGFEALLRGKAVSTLGQPFYAGWGLSVDADPPARPRPVTLDELIAAALILYPRYIDPQSRLPAPVERVIEALAEERGRRASPRALIGRAGNLIMSEIMNAAEAPKWRILR
ncbi:hypothetical protein KHP62_01205 [Rhodobacteraceae bacterium NNCM2]|nr:hypothetical protein [Coraliihabitans acroporae]